MPRVNRSPTGRDQHDAISTGSSFERTTSETELVTRSSSVAGSVNTAFTMDADERFPWRSDFPKTPSFDEIMTINVGGFTYQTRTSTLAKIPTSLLADPKRREEYYDPGSKCYFFDRNRLAFDSILEYYRTGKLIKPHSVPIYVFIREMLFFDLGDDMVNAFLRAEELYDDPIIVPTNKVQKVVYDLFNCPESSIPARLIAVLDISLVLTAIVGLCVMSLPAFQEYVPVDGSSNDTMMHRKEEYKSNTFDNPFFVIDVICNSWFLLDVTVRFLVSPIKRYFFLDFMVFVDIISILPFLLDLILGDHGPSINFLLAFRIIRLFRVFRIFKMDEYSDGLKVLRQTIGTAHKELGIMALFLVVGAVFFSATMYYAERETANTDYTSIPASFWWAVITWTTIGYGDIYPKTAGGKVVGCVCAITGVLALAMIIPPVVKRFEHYFYRAENMHELEAAFREHWEQKDKEKARMLPRVNTYAGNTKDFLNMV